MADASVADPSDRSPAYDAWQTLAEKALKGAPLDTLNTVTADGLPLQPVYGPATPRYAGRPALAPWQVVCRVDDDTDPAGQALTDLESGATALALTLAGAPAAHGGGLSAVDVDGLDAALAGIHLDLIALHVEAGPRARPAAAALAALFARRGTLPRELHLGLDPLGNLLASGAMADWPVTTARLADTVRAIHALGVPGTLLRADGRMVHNAGGTAIDELAFAFASLAATVRALDAQGLGPQTTLPLAAMSLAADVDQPTTIAKFRAARRLFSLFAGACGVDAPLTLHATTGTRMLSYSDPQTNILRLTVAAFGAGVGGADALTVLPFDAAGSPFARRVSRNIQALLLDEAHLAAFADPAAGSGAFEALTEELAAASWARVQELERTGLLSAIASGAIVAGVKSAAAARHAALSAGERTLIGVTRHPPVETTPARPGVTPIPETTRLDVADPSFAALVEAAGRGATLHDLAKAGGPVETLTAPPLTPQRDAAPFED